MTETNSDAGAAPMRLEIDAGKCCGYGNCVLAAPDLFDLDERTNLAVVLVPEVPAADRPLAERAMDECPTLAITARS